MCTSRDFYIHYCAHYLRANAIHTTEPVHHCIPDSLAGELYQVCGCACVHFAKTVTQQDTKKKTQGRMPCKSSSFQTELPVMLLKKAPRTKHSVEAGEKNTPSAITRPSIGTISTHTQIQRHRDRAVPVFVSGIFF